MKRLLLGLVPGLLVLLLIGGTAFDNAAQAQNLPEPVVKTKAEIPPDAAAVAKAIIERLHGRDGTNGVRFANGAGADLAEGDFRYAGFEWHEGALFAYQQGAAGEASRKVSGRLDLEDDLGRKTSVLFSADYVLQGEALVITRAEAAPLFPETVENEMYLLEADVLSGEGLPEDHAGLLRLARENAITWDNPEEVFAGERDYVVMVVLMERVSPSAITRIRISDSESGAAGYEGGTQYLNDSDFRIGVIAGSFALDTTKLFVKVAFSAGTETAVLGRTEKLAGLYSLAVFAEDGKRRGLNFSTMQGGQVANLPISRFDGKWVWRINLSDGEPECQGKLKGKSQAKDGEFETKTMHPHLGRILFGGTIDQNGGVKGTDNHSVRVTVEGGMSSDSEGQGTLKISFEAYTCSGTWTAQKG